LSTARNASWTQVGLATKVGETRCAASSSAMRARRVASRYAVEAASRKPHSSSSLPSRGVAQRVRRRAPPRTSPCARHRHESAPASRRRRKSGRATGSSIRRGFPGFEDRFEDGSSMRYPRRSALQPDSAHPAQRGSFVAKDRGRERVLACERPGRTMRRSSASTPSALCRCRPKHA